MTVVRTKFHEICETVCVRHGVSLTSLKRTDAIDPSHWFARADLVDQVALGRGAGVSPELAEMIGIGGPSPAFPGFAPLQDAETLAFRMRLHGARVRYAKEHAGRRQGRLAQLQAEGAGP